MTAITAKLIYSEGWRVALIGEAGRKYLPVTFMEDNGLRLHKLPITDERHFHELPGTEYRRSVGYVARRLLDFGRETGRSITGGARELLTQAIEQTRRQDMSKPPKTAPRTPWELGGPI